jgi:1-acyl-sn-glycerol-3-phosphate acyltransferase
MIIFYFIHTLIIYTVVIIDTIIFSILAIIFGLMNPYSKATNWCIRSWARIILWTSGVKLVVEGLENIKKEQAYVYVINHISMFDIPSIVVAVPQTARFIAKKELFKIPLFSTGMRLAGILAIDRGNSDEAKKTLNKAINTIKNDHVSVLIFPEGTRSKTNRIESFKKGGFIIALDGKIPIIPVVISGSQYIVPKGSGLVKRGKIHLQFLKETETKEYSWETRNKLVNNVRDKMIEAFNPDFNRK